MVFDVPNKNQVGATMRTIESLSVRKKILTTNTNVLNECFYRKENFCIWPNDDSAVLGFMNGDFKEDSYNLINSLDTWLDTIFAYERGAKLH